VFLHDVHHASTVATVATLLVVQIGGGTARIWSGRFSDRPPQPAADDQDLRPVGGAS